jgi:predicted CDP-diglyceride synthetase/phosphatidate cytidylyltransferase
MILDIDFSSPNNLLVLIIFMILILASSVFYIWKRIQPNALVDQMIKTTQSWWVMCFVFLFCDTF